MKQYILFTGIFLFILASITAQSTDRFIRIVGNAKKEFVATGVVASVNISEQQPNEYKQVPYMPFEAVYTNYLEELFTLGILENQLVKSQKNMAKFSTLTAKEYTIRLTGNDAVEKLTSIRAPGVQITELKYTFSEEGMDTESVLAKSAIEDARRKAQALCKDLTMRLGKILNIEDTSSGCCGTPPDSPTSTIERSYKVNVTFELSDL